MDAFSIYPRDVETPGKIGEDRRKAAEPQQRPLKCGGGGEISALYLDRPSFPLCDKRTENYDDGALNCRGERRKEQMRGGDSGGRQRSLL